MYLFWVETEDHGEDWFVVAKNAVDACAFFEEYEGYPEGTASARLCSETVLADDIASGDEAYWPEQQQLEELGAVMKYNHGGVRVVELNGETYAEGLLQSQMFMLPTAPLTADDEMWSIHPLF